MDSVALLDHVCTELSCKRRDALKPFLHQDFRSACARSRKPGKLLFGNDLAKTLQELKTTNKIMINNSSDARKYKRSTGHSRQENIKYQQKRFLVNRGRTFNPPFRAGQVSLFYEKWMQLTSDLHILQTIAGETIEFSPYPIQLSYPPNSICKDHVALVEAEIYSLKEKEVIVPCYHELGEFNISYILSSRERW